MLLCGLLASGPVAASDAASDYIVVLRGSPSSHSRLSADPGAVQSLLSKTSVTRTVSPTHLYSAAISGFSARLSARQVDALLADPRVASIVPDEEIGLADGQVDARQPALNANNNPTPSPSPEPSATPNPTPTPRATLPTPGPDRQIVPTGVERVGRPSLDGAHLNGHDNLVDVDLAIVDTGVAQHPDLNVVGGVDCTNSRIGWDDGNGHGTHVAGTAAARDNDFGVVGVAPGARIWSVKVLNSRGRGKASWLLCGIDWIAAQRDGDKALIEVANMSLIFHGVTRHADDGDCGNANHDAVHQAICASSADGTIFVVAAGNYRDNAAHYRPASYDEVITVSALSDFDGKPGGLGVHSEVCPPHYSGDRDDVLASFSNYGKDVDIMAPGKCIWSTSKSGGYRAMSGTSMATPHVSGAVALYLLAHPDWSFNQVRDALIQCGTQDWRWKSDHDKHHEPVLNVSRLC